MFSLNAVIVINNTTKALKLCATKNSSDTPDFDSLEIQPREQFDTNNLCVKHMNVIIEISPLVCMKFKIKSCLEGVITFTEDDDGFITQKDQDGIITYGKAFGAGFVQFTC
jgi:hypothetical protein